MNDCKVQARVVYLTLLRHTIFQYTADSEQLALGLSDQVCTVCVSNGNLCHSLASLE